MPNFPTLIVSGFIALAAINSFFAGLILATIAEKDRQTYEFRLQLIENERKLNEILARGEFENEMD